MKIKVTMTWNISAKKWLMTMRDIFIYDFWNCGTIIKAFKGLDKKRPTSYWLVIEKAE